MGGGWFGELTRERGDMARREEGKKERRKQGGREEVENRKTRAGKGDKVSGARRPRSQLEYLGAGLE